MTLKVRYDLLAANYRAQTGEDLPPFPEQPFQQITAYYEALSRISGEPPMVRVASGPGLSIPDRVNGRP